MLVVLQAATGRGAPHLTTQATLLTGMSRLVLLQISKIATILRRTRGLRIAFHRRRPILSRRLDDVAIGPPGHHTVLHLARRSEIAGEPDSHSEQDDGDNETHNRTATIVVGFLWLVLGVGHRAVVLRVEATRCF
jgi:hypothetical protein